MEVQRIVREENLLENVRQKGELLSRLLQEKLGAHPNVADIRGRGLFWSIEFTQSDKKTAFPAEKHVAAEISDLGLAKHSIAVYPGAGTVDGIQGDHIIISPAYNVSTEEVETIVSRVTALIENYFGGQMSDK